MGLDAEDLAIAVRSFKRGSAGATDGLKPMHVRQVVYSARLLSDTSAPLAALAGLSNLVLAARAPPNIAGGRLAGIQQGPKVHPIGVNQVYSRIAGKCVCTALKPRFRELFVPEGHMGVAEPMGAEAVVHTVRDWMHRHRNDTTALGVKIDGDNAVNNADRAKMLAEVHEHVPDLFAFTQWACQGAVQGDTKMPPLFALLMRALMKVVADRLRREGHLRPDLGLQFLDDVWSSSQAPS
eukprot:gene1676-3718_t